MCGKCKKSMAICPFSFGLALGVTCAIATFIWAVWIMKYGVPANMISIITQPTSYAEVWTWTGLGLVKGFVFGLVLALFYDLFACYCKARCCKKDMDGKCSCDCGCKTCSTSNRPKVE